MAAQKRPSQRHGSKYLASASTMDHARHGFLPRHRDSGFLDSLGRFFGGDRGVPKRGSGKDTHHAVRTTHYGSLPQKAQHGRAQDENPVVHFFKSIVTPRTPPPSQGKGRGLSLSRFSWVGEDAAPAPRPPPPPPPPPPDVCVPLFQLLNGSRTFLHSQLARRGVRPTGARGCLPLGGRTPLRLLPHPASSPPATGPARLSTAGTLTLSTLGSRALELGLGRPPRPGAFAVSVPVITTA
uniref:Myelin basic protein n=1 Tax=Rousettus aegyptiacus TaxID=9407 RepID=A0A7J8DJA9_ROUAE|nr:myelin basic protein [Rousettus aegyptiacus]